MDTKSEMGGLKDYITSASQGGTSQGKTVRIWYTPVTVDTRGDRQRVTKLHELSWNDNDVAEAIKLAVSRRILGLNVPHTSQLKNAVEKLLKKVGG